MAPAPIVETLEASFIGSTIAYLNGRCIAAYEGSVPYIIFRWGLTTDYGNWTPYYQAIPGEQYSHRIEELSPNVTYHFQIAGRLGDLWSYGADKSFKTLPEAPPPPETPFMGKIIEFLVDVSDWFYSISEMTIDWIWPFYLVADFFYEVYVVFNSLAWEFSYFTTWVEEISEKIVLALTFGSIYSYFKDIFDAALDAWDWVTDAVVNILDAVDDWWEGVSGDVQDWIDAAIEGIGDIWELVKENVEGLITAAVQFIGVTIAAIQTALTAIEVAWSDFSTDVLPTLLSSIQIDDLIKSWFTDYEPFWAGWQDWKDQVVEFFTDPWEWLYNKFDDFIERFW